jgi:hypothetical protein
VRAQFGSQGDTSRLDTGRVSVVSLAETIATENEFRTAMPRHTKGVFEDMQLDPALKLQRWAFAPAVVRRPDWPRCSSLRVQDSLPRSGSSVAPDGEGGWSVQQVLKTAPLADGESDYAR